MRTPLDADEQLPILERENARLRERIQTLEADNAWQEESRRGLGNEKLELWATIERLRADKAALVGALKEAEAQFRWYAQLHREKKPPDIDKAKTNEMFADRCRAALAAQEKP